MIPRPNFIPENIWNREFQAGQLQKYFLVDRLTPQTFITNRKNAGREIDYIKKESNSAYV